MDQLTSVQRVILDNLSNDIKKKWEEYETAQSNVKGYYLDSLDERYAKNLATIKFTRLKQQILSEGFTLKEFNKIANLLSKNSLHKVLTDK